MTHAPIPLTELATDQEGAVLKLGGGRTLVSRLATLGFTPGAPLKMVQNLGHGPLIVRVRDTRPQVGLPVGERQANVAGAFEAARELTASSFLLVDDVLTTGATASACAAALRAAGAESVDVLTIARAESPNAVPIVPNRIRGRTPRGS